MGLEPGSQWILNSGIKVQPKYDLELDLDPELTPPQQPQSAKVWHRWDQTHTGPYIQVKKYNPNMDLELDQDPELTLQNWPQFGTHMVMITLDDSICKKLIISTSDTYIFYTCEKV